MAGREIFNPNSFKNTIKDNRVIGFEFGIKAQYYRGITLSIVRDLNITIDEQQIKREDILFSVNDATFTLEEMRTVIDSDYRWEFGEFAKVTVLKEDGLPLGEHHIKVIQVLAPSYMPFQIESICEIDFNLSE
ncbi:hypothetical protein BN1356_00520 [Streptococcus varani]|uniref:C-deglycosylation enzyme beta subunit n=1 Tax=Streptococcus varani TaxID=1608583 RepID=A0A0E4H301_9STRE|nr:DUF6379 domain-containing protein [Streptococcus varani]CQR24159.1 hypothetical protein BN1356_00520 [Streptococcus varani]